MSVIILIENGDWRSPYIPYMFWLTGTPGSGRGTLCEKLKRTYRYTHLSSGDLLKAEIMSGSSRGDILYSKISSGERVSNEIVDDLIGEAMMWTAGGSDVSFCYMYKK